MTNRPRKRLDVAMAVSVDAAAVLAATVDQEYGAGERLFASGAVSEVQAGYGGVNADVADDGEVWQVWVGVVERALTGECDCPDGEGAAMCRHGVAAALAAVAEGHAWQALPEEAGEPESEAGRYRALAESLTYEELVELVVRHALEDDAVAADLRGAAAVATA